MKKILEYILSFARFYKRFGYHGVNFIVQKYLKQNKLVTFSHPDYKYPIFIRNNTTDIPTFYQTIYNEDYNIAYDFHPKVIIDCGANIGLATVFFKNKFPEAKIISIEPEQSNFNLLLKNTSKYSDVFCLNGGIWNKATNLVIQDSGKGNWGFRCKETSNSNEFSVRAIPLGEIIKEHNIDCIDILKIDIEGSEKELFESNVENWLPKTRVIIIETHDRINPGASKSFFKAINDYDFSMTHRGENMICFLK